MALNVRRLMYQPLIFPAVAGDDAGGLAAALDSQRVNGAADALVDGMRRDAELGGDLLRRQMLVDEAQAIELSRRESRDPPGHHIVRRSHWRQPQISTRAVSILQSNPQIGHGWPPPEQRVFVYLMLCSRVSPCFG